MSQLIETIRLEDGIIYNQELHQERIKKSLYDLYNATSYPDITKILSNEVFPQEGLYKIRLIYNCKSTKTECVPYTLRTVKKLKLIECSDIKYAYKWEDRKELNNLCSQKGDCDDILIVKNGLITDTSYTNIIFQDRNEWLTPSFPLLKGTQRQFLIQQGIIKEADIRIEDLGRFSRAGLINAMLPFDRMPMIRIDDIII
ncbi:MAG: aminotransferase class IV [Bacteroidota bacterium]|nr:aminotransferase class IV [Bacteroidota bacterium]